MTLSEVRAGPTMEAGSVSNIGCWVPLQPARRRARHEAAVEGSKELREDRLAQAVESRHLVVMRPGQQATERTPTMNDVGKVLKAWRAAERELIEIRESSPEWLLVHAEIISLRAAYHRLFEERWQLAASY
jgi:hypothetical protein